MTRHFDHIPVEEPSPESGNSSYEHCLNHIGANDEFWREVDDLFKIKSKLKDKAVISAFKNDLLEYLANFTYDNPPHVAKNYSRQARIEALQSISNAVEKLQKNYRHIKTSMFLHFSEEATRQDDYPENAELQWYAYLKEREFRKNLKVLQKLTQIDVPTNEDPAIMNAHLQECLAIYLAESLLEMGIKATTTRYGFFEELFRICCIALGFKEPSPGNDHVKAARDHIHKITKRA